MILMDVDGVVIAGRHQYFSELYAEEHNIPIEDIMPFFKNEFKLCAIGQMSIRDALPPYLEKWGWKGTLDEFLEYWFSSERQKNDELLELIDKLGKNGNSCYLATNQEKERAEYIMEEVGLRKYFDGAFVSCSLGVKKSEPDFFLKIAETLKKNLEDFVYWDSDPENVEVAEKLGIESYVYKDIDDFKEKMSVLLK